MMMAAQAVQGLVSGVTGFIQRSKGNKLLRANPYPTYNIPSEILRNQKTADVMANTGMPGESYNLAKQNIARNLNYNISKATDRRGGLMTISAGNQMANDATANLDAENAGVRTQNRKLLMDVNSQVAGYKDKAFDWNVKNKYQQNYNYAMGLLGQGNQNIVSGVDSGSAAALYGANSSDFAGSSSNATAGSNVPGSYADYLKYKRLTTK